MIGRLIERLFVQVRADTSDLFKDLSRGVSKTKTATTSMALSWGQVERQVGLFTRRLERGRITQSQYISEMNRLSSSMKQVAGSYRQAQKEVWGYSTAARAAAASTSLAMDTKPVKGFVRSAGQARMQMLNLGYQLNDIGMTLATGMNPMTVMMQQGSQIAQIYGGQGGVNQLFRDLGNIIAGIAKKFWPVVAVVGVLATGFAALTRKINQSTDVGVTMGDTFKAVFQVLGRNIYSLIEGPLNRLKEAWAGLLDFIIKWFPLVMNKVIGLMVGVVKSIGATWALLPDLWHDTWTAIKNTTLDSVQGVINPITQTMVPAIAKGLDTVIQIFQFAFEATKITWQQLPSIMKDAIGGAVNAVITGVEKMVNGAIQGINSLIAALQALVDFVGADKAAEFFGFSGDLPTIKKQDLDKWRMEIGNALEDTTDKLGEAAAKTFNKSMIEGMAKIDPTDLSGSKGQYRKAFGELAEEIDRILSESMNIDYLDRFFSDVKRQAIENALKRIASGMEDVGGAAKSAAEEVKEVMVELDDGLQRAAENLAEVFGRAFERLATTGKITFGDFIQELNRLIIRSTSELLQEELTKLFKSIITGARGRGSGGNIISRIFTNMFGGRARGGVEMPWRNFVAGEEGAELISQDGPAGARRVTTAGRTRHLMNQGGGSGPNVNITVYAQDVDSFRNSESQIASRVTRFLSIGERNR